MYHFVEDRDPVVLGFDSPGVNKAKWAPPGALTSLKYGDKAHRSHESFWNAFVTWLF